MAPVGAKIPVKWKMEMAMGRHAAASGKLPKRGMQSGSAEAGPDALAVPKSVRSSISRPRRDVAGQGDAVFWNVKVQDVALHPKETFHALVFQVKEGSPVLLYEAVEQGVPTYLVALLAGALGRSTAAVMDLIGVSESTFRRKEEAKEALPEVAGHRVMGFLRMVATLERLLEESGDPTQLATFDLQAWVSEWMEEPLAEFGGKTPADMLRNPEGQRAIEGLVERMRGGLPA